LDGNEIRKRKNLVELGKGESFGTLGPCRQRPTPPRCRGDV
jgi:hypothetical protein